ncbi:MAG: hypothetical protein ACREUV_09810 [Burkholderiales bacterium]
MAQARSKVRFALCVEDKDCDDLEKGKVYPVLSDAAAKRDGYLRVIDESGEDYLYPQSGFVFVDLPNKAKDALLAET